MLRLHRRSPDGATLIYWQPDISSKPSQLWMTNMLLQCDSKPAGRAMWLQLAPVFMSGAALLLQQLVKAATAYRTVILTVLYAQIGRRAIALYKRLERQPRRAKAGCVCVCLRHPCCKHALVLRALASTGVVGEQLAIILTPSFGTPTRNAATALPSETHGSQKCCVEHLRCSVQQACSACSLPACNRRSRQPPSAWTMTLFVGLQTISLSYDYSAAYIIHVRHTSKVCHSSLLCMPLQHIV